MIEFFLIFTLLNGQVYDVDAFLNLEGERGCQAALDLWNANKERVLSTRPGIRIDLIGCAPVQVPLVLPPAPA